MKDFLDIVHRRKTIRSFINKDIPYDVIEKILAVVVYAPTNCNQQLWNFILIKEQKTKEQLVNEAFANTLIRRAPVIVVVTYDGWNNKEAIQGASLAVGHMLLAAEYYGVHASPMNSYGADSAVKRILGIPETETICCFVILGYPDERAQKALPVPRRPINEVLHKEYFQKRPMPPFTYNPNDWALNDLRSYQRYYCRKTFLGKEMDIMNKYEKLLVRRTLQNIHGPLIDLFSYDGANLREFPDVPVTTLDLTRETAEYTRASVELHGLGKARFSHEVYSEKTAILCEQKAQAVTLLYKAERIAANDLKHIFTQAYNTLAPGGSFIIIARRQQFLLSPFFILIKILFGCDIRKTGIFNFFGPYRPVRSRNVCRHLRGVGFSKVRTSGHFLFPALYERIVQMFFQYLKSEGSSYLHRQKHNNILTCIVEWIVKKQECMKVGPLGSVIVITCTKQ